MQAEVRAVRLALTVFSAILPSTMDVWVDNTLLRGATNKGSSKSHVMMWELRRIYDFLESCGVRASFAYVRSAGFPQTAYHAVVFLHFRTWRRGGTCEGERRGLVAAGPKSVPILSLWIHKHTHIHYACLIRIEGSRHDSGYHNMHIYKSALTWCKRSLKNWRTPAPITFTPSHSRLVWLLLAISGFGQRPRRLFCQFYSSIYFFFVFVLSTLCFCSGCSLYGVALRLFSFAHAPLRMGERCGRCWPVWVRVLDSRGSLFYFALGTLRCCVPFCVHSNYSSYAYVNLCRPGSFPPYKAAGIVSRVSFCPTLSRIVIIRLGVPAPLELSFHTVVVPLPSFCLYHAKIVDPHALPHDE
ncbi:putative target of rapamycin (TOR) kinase 1 [Trypanosoma cruzi]|uniref:Putative target of rapamycin (TOR) kinase 1 n=1 Tax=Trypanosoma cruzi TaxID=5693 RepID=A0A2V2X0C0_TRYCR|nr:putative target of rapamycin (TOR) kinase 1 [Trypanosoma cruzi]